MRLKYFFCTSIGKKYLVALSGLGLGGFVLTHMSGNMLILAGGETYNKYSYALVSNPLILVAELGLLALFAAHVYFAISLTLANRHARPVAPFQLPDYGNDKRAEFASRSMIYTGLLTFVFLVLHLWTFKYGAHYSVTYQGVEMRDLHRLVLEKFRQPLYVVWYLFSLLVLGVHLSHGFTATLQSLGFQSVRNRCLKKAGWALTALIIVGFMSQPIYVFMGGN